MLVYDRRLSVQQCDIIPINIINNTIVIITIAIPASSDIIIIYIRQLFNFPRSAAEPAKLNTPAMITYNEPYFWQRYMETPNTVVLQIGRLYT